MNVYYILNICVDLITERKKRINGGGNLVRGDQGGSVA